jgi:hypothetical protein
MRVPDTSSAAYGKILHGEATANGEGRRENGKHRFCRKYERLYGDFYSYLKENSYSPTFPLIYS